MYQMIKESSFEMDKSCKIRSFSPLLMETVIKCFYTNCGTIRKNEELFPQHTLNTGKQMKEQYPRKDSTF